MCGDSTDSGDVAGLMGGKNANMTVTDPPYNVSYGEHGGASGTGRKRAIQNDDLGERFYDFLLIACQNILSHTDGAVYIFIACAELHTLQRAFVDAGGHWSTFIIWAKNTFTLGRSETTKDSTNQSCTAGGKATNTIGVVTGTRATSGVSTSPPRAPYTQRPNPCR